MLHLREVNVKFKRKKGKDNKLITFIVINTYLFT